MTEIRLTVDSDSPVFMDRLAQACGDPGSIVGRQHHINEPLSRWQMRAVLHVLAEMGARNTPRFCDKTPNCRMAAGHNGGCRS